MARGEGENLADSVISQAAVVSELMAARLEASLKMRGVGLGAFELLSAVKGSPSATQAEIASNLGITPSSLCEAIRSAANKGLIDQEDSSRDRRAKRLVLTRKGAQILEDALRVVRETEETGTQGILPARAAAAVEVLRLVAANLTRSSE